MFSVNTAGLKNCAREIIDCSVSLGTCTGQIDGIANDLDPSLQDLIPALNQLKANLSDLSTKSHNYSMGLGAIAMTYDATENSVFAKCKAYSRYLNSFKSANTKATSSDYSRSDLVNDLDKEADEFLAYVKDTYGWNSKYYMLEGISAGLYGSNAEKALAYVEQYKDEIEKAAAKYGIEKEVLQALIFQERRFFGVDDVVADSETNNYYVNVQLMQMVEDGTLSPSALNLLFPASKDSSTGPGQITIAAAMDAYQTYLDNGGDPIDGLGTGLDYSKDADCAKMWDYLKEPENNINMLCLVLKDKAGGENITADNMQAAFQAYNGGTSGSKHSVKYGETVVDYYEFFKKYNQQ